MAELSLAIVTCVKGYGQYLPDWTRSILALHRKPSMVAIVHNGHPGDADSVATARAALEAGGLRVRTEARATDNLGELRNAAVALSGDTEWVMHLDADDMILPHCLDDVAALAPNADVVALGYQRCGDLAAGPRTRVRLYSNTAGKTALKAVAPASGVSPFRRALWERAPYPTVHQEGAWDTALWLGFAHLGARFLATRRPCFLYRQHADSLFNRRRLAHDFARVLNGHQLQSRRRGDKGVSILVPRADHNDRARERAWAWLRQRLAALYPDWEIVEGVCPAGRFSRGLGLNLAAERAKGAVLVALDSDCVLPAAALRDGAALVESGAAPWVVPHRLVRRLDQRTSERILGGDPAAELRAARDWHYDRDPYSGYPGGGTFILPHAAYITVGGVPREFTSWGAEDEAIALILDTLLGPHRRLEHDLVHLWHPAQETKGARGIFRQSRQILRRYQAVARRPAEMWALLCSSPPLSQLVDHFTPDRRYRTLAAAAGAVDDGTNREAAMHDYFARRRLARAQAAKQQLGGTPPMAGALDITRAHAAARRKQAAINAAAQAERDRATARASELAKLPPADRRAAVNRDRQEGKMQPPPANKMVATPPPTKSRPSGVTLKEGVTEPSKATAPKLPPGSVVGTSGVPFASAAALRLAESLGLVTLGDFTGHDSGPRGFTTAAVRAIAAAKKLKAGT